MNLELLAKYHKYLVDDKKIPVPSLATSLLHSKGIPTLGFVGKKWLDELNIRNGKMIQIGATSSNKDFTSHPDRHPLYNGLEFYNFDLKPDNQPNTIVGDITNAPMLKDEDYIFVYSEDTFEHIKAPWKAASEMMRILKPGGMCFLYTCFSWRYHEVPVDYWRYTPSSLAFIFKELECLEANFDSMNRRGPIQGHVDSGASDMVPEDELGAWRENWRVYYVGRKPLRDEIKNNEQ